MKAYDIAIFLLMFNGVLWMFGVLGVFGPSLPAGSLITFQIELTEGVVIAGTDIVGAIAGAIVVVTIVVFGNRVGSPVGVVAVAFSFFYIYLLTRTMAILYEFNIDNIQLIPNPVLLLIAAINVVVFTAAIMQLVSGGWKPHK